jgi:glycosyltransferase involved in cell wall biosynthesis
VSARPHATLTPRSIGVLICSYRRPEQLRVCLAALAAQRRRPDEVLIVARADDAATHAAVEARPPDTLACRIVLAGAPGLVAARNVGLAACRSDIVAFCDDDTCPHPDWVRRILEHFQRDPELGGLGGRDRCHDGARFDERTRELVGRITWFGHAIGNHHLGHGAPREVQFLKGANMSYRREAIGPVRFDARLRGRGAQPHDDLGFSLAIRRSGWRVLYDPAVVLDHFAFRRAEPRPYVAGGGLPDPLGYRDSAYNLVLALWDALGPARRGAFVLWSLLVGTRLYPGLAQALRLTPAEGLSAWRKFALCQHGSLAACAMLLAAPRRRAPGAG